MQKINKGNQTYSGDSKRLTFLMNLVSAHLLSWK